MGDAEKRVGVFPGHTFFWDTELSEDRMEEISNWIVAPPKDEWLMLQDLNI